MLNRIDRNRTAQHLSVCEKTVLKINWIIETELFDRLTACKQKTVYLG